jgi:competence ComEA-like helix-hairpin-helix protein
MSPAAPPVLSVPAALPSLQKSPDVLAAWPRPAQWAMIFLLGAATALLAGHALKMLRWGTRPTELEPGAGLGFRIDLNRADRAELLQLPGVGDSLAQKILDYRRNQGAFREVDDLGKVPGFGPARLERLRPWICVETEEDEDAEQPAVAHKPAQPPRKKNPAPAKAGKDQKQAVGKKGASLKGKINVNWSPAAELQKLPHIGKVKAQRIIEERRKHPFKSVEDLKRVSGIGVKTIELLRPHVTFEDGPAHGAKID